MDHDESQAKKEHNRNTGIGLIVLGLFCLLIGFGFVAAPVTDKNSTISQGLLAGATASSGRRSNNTTLVILSENGDVARFEVKSSIKYGEIKKIRQRANENRGVPITYAAQQNRLYWVKFENGEELVSLAHMRAQRSWTGSMIFVFGILMGVFGFIRVRKSSSP